MSTTYLAILEELAKRTGGSANITDIGDEAGQRSLTRGIIGLLPEAVL